MEEINTEFSLIKEEGCLLLYVDGIDNKIKIDTLNKKIEKLKSFFEELIIKSFLNDKVYKIEINEKIKTQLDNENENFYNLFQEFIDEYEKSMNGSV